VAIRIPHVHERLRLAVSAMRIPDVHERLRLAVSAIRIRRALSLMNPPASAWL
jgi:hypothetical protein